MQARETGMDHPADREPKEGVRAWVESPDGSIARGLAETLSEDGAVIRLTGAGPIDPESEVAVRLSFDPAAPTVGVGARVLRILRKGESVECELAWTPGPERTRLGTLVGSARPEPGPDRGGV